FSTYPYFHSTPARGPQDPYRGSDSQQVCHPCQDGTQGLAVCYLHVGERRVCRQESTRECGVEALVVQVGERLPKEVGEDPKPVVRCGRCRQLAEELQAQEAY